MLIPLLLPAALATPAPGAPEDLAPDRDWDIQHLNLDLDLDPAAGRVEGTATLTMTPLLPGGDWITLNQVALEIRAVRVDGRDAPFELGDDTLRIRVSQRPEAPIEVAVDYAATPRKGLHFRAPGRDSPDTYLEVWSQGEDEDNRYWFPTWDDPSDRFTTSGRFTAPEGLRVLSNGVGSFDGEAWTYHMDQDLVSYLVMVAAADYQERTDLWGQVAIRQWYPPDATVEEVESVSQRVPEMMAYYSEKTGLDYPYPSYTEVFVQGFMYGGMENTTATVQTRELLIPEAWREAHPWSESVSSHELAHQWFGDTLTCETWSELWLNEGFATFFAGLWTGERFGDAAFFAKVDGWQRAARDAGVLSGRWWSTPEGGGVNTAVYVKGASVLQMLRATFGEDAFWAAIQRYTRENAHSPVNTEDLRAAFEAVTGQHLGWFFDQWTHLPGSPELSVDPSWSDGTLTVQVAQTQDLSSDRPLFYLPIDLEIGLAGGGVQTERFWTGSAEASFSVALPEPPAYVAFDPLGAVLGTVDEDQSAAAWRAQAASPSPLAQIRAVQALGDGRADLASVALLSELLLDSGEPVDLREEAAEALKSLAAGDPALLSALADAHPRIRIAAADALGATHHEGAGPVSDALTKVARRDPVPEVGAAAMRAMGGVAPQRARIVARELLRQRPDNHGHRQRAAAEVLGRRGTLDDLGALLHRVSPDTPRSTRHAAAAAAVKLVHRESSPTEAESNYARVARALEPMLDSQDLRTRQRGVGLLAEVGDERSADRLEALRRRETIEDLSDAIDRSLTAIRERSFTDQAASDRAALAEKLEALEARVKALEADEDDADAKR